jgi:DNA polymerase
VLRRQIEIVDPKILCALGRHAAQTLLGRPDPIGRLRGVWHEWEGRKLICTYHPSACLHNPDYKRPVWEDFQMLRDAYRAIRPL